MTTFVDQVMLHATAGNGGNGCVSIRREKFKPLAGPDGGNGGNGGDVILEVDTSTTTLLDFHHSPHRKATSGRQGYGSNRDGYAGEDLVLKVPDGTVVEDLNGGLIIDLLGFGTRYVLARGGRGGLGNAALASSKRRAPGFALLGEPGEEKSVRLVLKSVADIALVGYPSAGKSSLIASISQARPKIADYPFTTLIPNLGVVQAGDMRYTVADVPGLIPGASQGKGLGHEFLRHIERCAAIVHVIDAGALESERDPLTDLEMIEAELAEYGGLTDRPRIIALNKIDIPDARTMAEMVTPALKERGYAVFPISTATHEGLRDLTYAMGMLVKEVRAATPIRKSARIVIRPIAVNDSGFTITKDGDAFVVRGEKPERWVRQTEFANSEAVGYLADRLARLGVEKALFAAGAKAGDEVRIGAGDAGVIFDWVPSIEAGAELLHGPRGIDLRLDQDTSVDEDTDDNDDNVVQDDENREDEA